MSAEEKIRKKQAREDALKNLKLNSLRSMKLLRNYQLLFY